MAITLQVSEVRAEIYKSAGGHGSAGAGEASTALLGQIFHEAFAELVGDDKRLNFHAALDEAELSLAEWQTALLDHAYQKLIGPRLLRHQAALNFVPEQVLTFWQGLQELCQWLSELLWKANEKGLSLEESLFTVEQPLRWELCEDGWSDSVVLTGVADAVCRIPDQSDWCLIELKTGRTAPEADLAQACLYHQMLAASGVKANGALALISFQPQKHEHLFGPGQLDEAQNRLRELIGKMAGVARELVIIEPIPQTEHKDLGRKLQKAFAEYNVEIKANNPIVGPTFLRFPIELGKKVTVKSVRQRIEEVQVRMNLDAPPRVCNEGGRLSIDLQRPDRQIVYFSQIRSQLPPVDMKFGNAKVPIGIDLDGQLRMADFSQAENAHLLVVGTTGSGKSEWLRSAVAGLLLTNSPNTLRLALADPKRNAFQFLRQSIYLYNGIAYDENAALAQLEGLVEEMEARYRLMSKVNADKLTDFIRHTGEPLPRIFFFCDEYADLMMGERKMKQNLESLIRRLGQKARAAGIHLILATQQPSRQVMSGPILAVITAKIALRMQGIESRILMGESGAESLLGKGDLLYKCIGEPVRLQSPFLPEPDWQRYLGGNSVYAA